jgi:thiol-disulfide isomerase/thioredoxin
MKKITHLLLTACSVFALQAQALTIEPYSSELLAKKKQSGELVALHFHAFWCPTCWAQDKVFKSFLKDPDVPGALLVVNYDTERELRRQLNVRSQSTLIVYKGAEEQKRSIGETDASVLRHSFTDVK